MNNIKYRNYNTTSSLVTEELWFDSRRGKEMFLPSKLSRPALGPTHPPIQLTPAELSQGVKLPEREADHSPPSSTKFGAVPPHPRTPS
jgi:hypothetical protein